MNDGGFRMDPSLHSSFEACRRITRRYAKSFYFSSFFLPIHKREAAYAIYAFCRHADDLLDVDKNLSYAQQRQHLQQTLNRLYQGGPFEGLKFGKAFYHAIMNYSIPRIYFEELIEGVCSDHGRIRFQDFDELSSYCYRVASVVGLMMTRILELHNPVGEKHAIELGIAMQLTNILRDIGEDYQRDRIYLPANEMSQFGLTEDDIRQKRICPSFIKFMKFQIHRARDYYKKSEAGIRLLANDGSQFTVWTMRWVYAGILDEIENADYNVYRKRVHVSLPKKLRLAWRARASCRKQTECPVCKPRLAKNISKSVFGK